MGKTFEGRRTSRKGADLKPGVMSTRIKCNPGSSWGGPEGGGVVSGDRGEIRGKGHRGPVIIKKLIKKKKAKS